MSILSKSANNMHFIEFEKFMMESECYRFPGGNFEAYDTWKLYTNEEDEATRLDIYENLKHIK